MTGSGGMGAMPSNRLARLLEEKAEALRKRRKTAEAASERAEEMARSLVELGVDAPELPARQEKIREWQRKSDWDASELEAQDLTKYLVETAPALLTEKRRELMEWVANLQGTGGSLPEELTELAPQVRELTFRSDFPTELATLARYATLIRGTQARLAAVAREQVMAVAQWVGIPNDRTAEIDRRLSEILPSPERSAPPGWVDQLRDAIPEMIPEAAQRRELSRRGAEAIAALGRELSVPTAAVEMTLSADLHAPPTMWGETVPAVERSVEAAQGELRNRVGQVLAYLVTTLNSLREHGTDPTEAVGEIERLRIELETAEARDLGGLLARARTLAEEPLVGVVAGLLDEVRPKLVEARELGRDPSEVFASMNRAREALRLKIYSEALAASVEAIDRVTQLTSDLDAAREESEALGRLISRLESLTSTVQPFQAALTEITALLDHYEIDAARRRLRETVRALGRETSRYFGGELQRLSGAAEIAGQRGFQSEEVPPELERARQHLDAGALPEAGEALARADVLLRTAAGPYIARRVDEMRRGFEEIGDKELATNTLRSLADADIALRVKEDLSLSLESLRHAEREFSAAFAAESSSLLEALEERQRILEEMGGAGSEFLRQTDEIQQIFDMGDFVKSARSAREFLTATEQTQRSRAEEALSHGKLDLVELGKLGVGKPEFTKRFEAAQQDVVAARWVEAYRSAVAVDAEATKLLNAARSSAVLITRTKEQLLQIEQGGTDTAEFQQEVSEAERSFRELKFDAVREHLARVEERLAIAAQATETRRLIAESEQLAADAIRLGISVEASESKLAESRGTLATTPGAAALALAQEAHEDLVRMLVPVLEENLKSVEEDYEIARRSGVEMGAMSGLLAEASRRVALPVPVGAAERIEEARTQLSQTRGLLEHAERGVKRVEEAFGQAELLKLATPSLRERVGALEAQLKDGQFARTIDLAGPLEQEILQLTSQHLTRTIAGLNGLVARARQDGVSTTASENLLARAKDALQRGRPMEALQLAAQSEGEIERVGLQTRVARGALEAIDSRLARFSAERIRSPRGAAIADEARGAFAQGEYSRVIELSLEASELLDQTREVHRHAEEALEFATAQVHQALGMGAEPTEVSALLQRARDAAGAGEYATALTTAREATELSWWAIERRYASAIAEVRALLGTGPNASPSDSGSANALLFEAEASLQAKEWVKAGEAVDRARTLTYEQLDGQIGTRLRALRPSRSTGPAVEESEADRLRQWESALEEARSRRAYSEMLRLIEEEERRGEDSRRSRLETRVSELKDRLWVGERLGLDTTPAMERFSEARMALDQGRLDAVEGTVREGNASLDSLIREGISNRSKQVETELLYARDGLRVRIGDMAEQLGSVDAIAQEGRLVDAGRVLLSVEEDLNQRKSLHRQLMNLHYLIEAALRRASDAHLDSGESRRLFEASIRESATNYAEAIAKARAALKLVEGLLKASEPPTAFWPFKRPSSDGSDRSPQ